MPFTALLPAVVVCLLLTLWGIGTCMVPVAASSELALPTGERGEHEFTSEDREALGEPSQEQLEGMQQHCRDLDDHLSFFTARTVIQPERRLFAAIHHTMQDLQELQETTHRKDARQFSCQESYPWMTQSNHMQTVVRLLNDIVAGTGEDVAPQGLSTEKILDNLGKFHRDIEFFGMVSTEVLDDISLLGRNIHYIMRSAELVNELMASLKALSVGGRRSTSEKDEKACVGYYHDLVGLLESFASHHLPNWEPVEEGVKSMIQECKEDEYISGRKKIASSSSSPSSQV